MTFDRAVAASRIGEPADRMRTSQETRSTAKARRRVAGILLGLALGVFVDGILLYQILQ